MLAFLVVFLVGPVAGFLLAFLLVFLAALWVKFCKSRSPDVSRSQANDGKPRGIPGINAGPRSGKDLNRSSSSTKNKLVLRRPEARRSTALFERQLCEAAALVQPTLKQITERCGVVAEAAKSGVLDRSAAQGIVSHVLRSERFSVCSPWLLKHWKAERYQTNFSAN
jgi:hypothetical protein